MAIWLLSLVISGCLAFPGTPKLQHPSQDLIDGITVIDEIENEKGSRIIGGSSADISDYPWQASLRRSGSHICGAVILDENFLLTAAHCVGSAASYYQVYVGSSSRTSGGTLYDAQSIVMHPDFVNDVTSNGAFPNDVAVIKLSKSMSMGDNVKAIGLTAQTNANLANYPVENCVITGWGLTSSNGQLPRNLQKTNVKVLTDAYCKGGNVMGSAINDDIHICLDGEGSSGSCNGDSGGPLACNVGGTWELAGVTSFGYSGCPTNYPSVYAETYSFRNWIDSTKKGMM